MDLSLSKPVSLWDGLILVSMLVVSRYGFWLKTYGDFTSRQWVSSIIGFIFASLILDDDVGYFVLVTFTTITLICLVGPRYCHIVSLVTMFGYLSLYRLNREGQIDIFANYLLASTTLNLTGVAFEINKAYKNKLKALEGPPRPKIVMFLEDDLLKINFINIFHYIYCYITIFTGPYVRYHVYVDFITLPYALFCKRPSLSEDSILTTIPFMAVAFWILHIIWPITYVATAEFVMRGILYKLLFCAVLCFKFRLFNYIYNYVRLQLSMYAGYGVYDKNCKTVPVYGPTTYPENLVEVIKRRFINVPTDIEFDMETVEVMKPLECELSSSISEFAKFWDSGLFYWMDEHINKSLLEDVSNANIRYLITSAICILWHGVHPTLLVLGATTLYYHHVESIFLKLKDHADKQAKIVIEVGLWLSKQIIFSWCLMPLFMRTFAPLFSFYMQIYFLPLCLLGVLHFIGSHIDFTHDEKGDLSDSEKYVTFRF